MLIGGASQAETCLGRIAKIFEIHQCTLNRRLKAQGTSFKTLIDETGYDVPASCCATPDCRCRKSRPRSITRAPPSLTGPSAVDPQ